MCRCWHVAVTAVVSSISMSVGHTTVRLIGFEKTRITAELEFPIEPGLRTVQQVPLSHLVEYDEADPHLIRSIYGRLAPFLHQRRAQLAPAPVARTHDQREERRATRSGAGRRSSMAGWWAVAGFLSCIYGCLHDGHVCHRVRQEDDPWLRAPGSRLSSSASASPLFLACCRCRRRRRI